MLVFQLKNLKLMNHLIKADSIFQGHPVEFVNLSTVLSPCRSYIQPPGGFARSFVTKNTVPATSQYIGRLDVNMAACLLRGRFSSYLGYCCRQFSNQRERKIGKGIKLKKISAVSGATIVGGSLLWLVYLEHRRLSSVNALTSAAAKIKTKVNPLILYSCSHAVRLVPPVLGSILCILFAQCFYGSHSPPVF